jgi:glycosyltransferase involved in cell wall biosynthesis
MYCFVGTPNAQILAALSAGNVSANATNVIVRRNRREEAAFREREKKKASTSGFSICGASPMPVQFSSSIDYSTSDDECPTGGDHPHDDNDAGQLPAFSRSGFRAGIHLLCIGGEDHNLRIPFLLALRDRGFRITAAGTGDPAPFADAGLDYHLFHFDRFINPLADTTTLSSLAKLISDVRPDVVQSFDTKPNLLVPLAARNLPHVLVVRTINGLGLIYSSNSLTALALRQVYPALHRLAARSTALTIFQNSDDRAFFERFRMIGKGGSRLIPGSGVDTEGFDSTLATGPSRAELRQKLGLGASEVVITVTRITKQKGVLTLLAAAALVHKARPSVRFLLVGPRESEGSSAIEEDELDRHAAYVTAIGRRSDVPSLLGLADVFAFPTEYREGVPRVLLEAALAGLPIITTKMPGCSDVIRDGWSGWLVPPSRPDLLAERILNVLNHRELARVVAARASKFVRSEFGLQITAARYAQAYTELVDRSGQNGSRDLNGAAGGANQNRGAHS